MKRKWLAFLSAMMLSLSLAACGTTENPENSQQSTVEVVSSEEKSEELESTEESSVVEENQESSEESKASESSEESKESEPAESAEPVESSETEEEGLNDAMTFVSGMTIGWNLGNTFDAYDCNWLNNSLDYETAWQGSKTTREMIKTLKNKGFNAIRIPVSWHNHVDDAYQIKAEWMNRVNEVVDMCIDEDMYVILNTHHDISKKFIYPTRADYDRSEKFLVAIWEQISERYKDYDEKLIFESMNETRLVGHNNEWWFDYNSADCKEAAACINDLNQAFVNTVRQSGGNNAERYLVIPGYDSSLDGLNAAHFVMPTDPSNEDPHMILVVHAYSPYSFALDINGTDAWSSKKLGDTNDLVAMMKTIKASFLDKGIPVIIDEFGSVNKNNNLEARVDHAGYYIKLASNFGVPCFWWDNHNQTNSGEQFTLLNRSDLTWKYPEIVDAMIDNLKK